MVAINIRGSQENIFLQASAVVRESRIDRRRGHKNATAIESNDLSVGVPRVRNVDESVLGGGVTVAAVAALVAGRSVLACGFAAAGAVAKIFPILLACLAIIIVVVVIFGMSHIG